MEIVELLTNHYMQIVCQTYTRFFTYSTLLNHLKNHRKYILLSLQMTGMRVTNMCLSCTFSLVFLLPDFTSTYERRSFVSSILEVLNR